MKLTNTSPAMFLTVSGLLSFIPIHQAFSAVTLADGVTYTQSFDTMTGGKGGTVNPPIPPAEWAFTGQALNAGSGGDRAFGIGGVANGSGSFGTSFQISTGGPTVNLEIAFTGEQWYYGGSPSVGDFLDFEYSRNATSLSTGTWTQFNSLDFNGPGDGLTGGAQATNGNASSFRTAISDTLSLTNVADNDVIWIRWSDVGTTGDQLAVDDFAITSTAVPEPQTMLLCMLAVSGLGLLRQRRSH